MKVLFLTKYPYKGASSRYRVYQYLPYLKEMGVDFEVQSFMSDYLYSLTFTKGNHLKKTALIFLACIARIFKLVVVGKFDVIYMQREILPFGPLLLERLLKRKGCRLVFDYDDALFIKRVNSYNPIAAFFKSEKRFIGICKLSDMVLAGNDYLASYAKPYCNKSYTFEVAEDTGRIKGKFISNLKADVNRPLVIGWLGSKTTAKYLHLISNVLIKLSSKYPDVVFEIVGSDQNFSITGVPLKLTEWSLDGELDALNRFDIGLMPLPLEDWSKGKSGGKARTYMAAGVVPVVTNIGYNAQLIQDGVTGFLVKTEDEWMQKLSVLIENKALRQEISASARQYVISNFSVEEYAKALKAHLEAAVMENQK